MKGIARDSCAPSHSRRVRMSKSERRMTFRTVSFALASATGVDSTNALSILKAPTDVVPRDVENLYKACAHTQLFNHMSAFYNPAQIASGREVRGEDLLSLWTWL